MKKAKIMLMAIAVVGVVGGTLAFKTSKSFSTPIFYGTVVAGKSTCILKQGFTTIVNASPAGFNAFATLTTNPNAYTYTLLPVAEYCTSPVPAYVNAGE